MVANRSKDKRAKVLLGLTLVILKIHHANGGEKYDVGI